MVMWNHVVSESKVLQHEHAQSKLGNTAVNHNIKQKNLAPAYAMLKLPTASPAPSTFLWFFSRSPSELPLSDASGGSRAMDRMVGLDVPLRTGECPGNEVGRSTGDDVGRRTGEHVTERGTGIEMGEADEWVCEMEPARDT